VPLGSIRTPKPFSRWSHSTYLVAAGFALSTVSFEMVMTEARFLGVAGGLHGVSISLFGFGHHTVITPIRMPVSLDVTE